MKKRFLTVCSFLFIFNLYAQNNSSATGVPSPFEPEILKTFADSLYSEGFLTQAESEYKRYLFSFPQNQKNDNSFQTTLLDLTNIYKKQNNLSGIEWLKKNFYSNAATPVKEKINFVQADFLFKTRSASRFQTFTNSIEQEKEAFSPKFVNLIDASSLLLDNDINGLKILCSGLSEINSDYEKLNELCQSYKLKSPGLALFFSTFLPGSGKWYTGSFGAFASSFITIGTFIAGTVVTGFQTEWQSWQPYVFGTCGLVLYIAELYGSYQSAKRYNDSLYRILCEETEKIYEKEY